MGHTVCKVWYMFHIGQLRQMHTITILTIEIWFRFSFVNSEWYPKFCLCNLWTKPDFVGKLAYNCGQFSIFIDFYVHVQQHSNILNSFMYCPYVCIQTSLLREMLAAFPAKVPDSFMYCLFVCIQISLLREMFSAFP